jgi:hypothetical protein
MKSQYERISENINENGCTLSNIMANMEANHIEEIKEVENTRYYYQDDLET